MKPSITLDFIQKVYLLTDCRYHYTYNSSSQPSNLTIPIITFNNLDNKDSLESYKKLLKNKGGIYSFINIVNNNQYIGSAKCYYLRLNEHLLNKSNIALQNAFTKYGLCNF